MAPYEARENNTIIIIIIIIIILIIIIIIIMFNTSIALFTFTYDQKRFTNFKNFL